MPKHETIDLSEAVLFELPFKHFCLENILLGGVDKQLYRWLEEEANWELTVEDFYTQYEMSLLSSALPEHLKIFIAEDLITNISDAFKQIFNIERCSLVGVTAHKLIDGYKIGIHNDYIGEQETHRLLIQLNSGWTSKNGGYLLLFDSPDVEDISKVISPFNNTAVGFEISANSYHAVSKVQNYSRFTIVYTFNND